MTRPIHGAYVEEYVDDEGDRYFVATCAETLIQCDAFAFPDIELVGWDGDGEERALARALEYLGDRSMHDSNCHDVCPDEHFCDADHIHVVDLDDARRPQ